MPNETRPDETNKIRSIHGRFERQARKTPNNIALIYAGETLTYSDLNNKANFVAKSLLEADVEREELVGICLERGPEIVIAILGVLKAGAAYLPIDPANPPERVQFILKDANVRLLLGGVSARDLPTGDALRQLAVEDLIQPARTGKTLTNLGIDIQANNLAYVIYTSGSTGKPKGVMVEHAQVDRLFKAAAQHFTFSEHDVWALFHSFAFDFSVWEIWGALFYGGRLVVVPYDVSRSPRDFYRVLIDQGVTVLNQTPSAFKSLIDVDVELSLAPTAHEPTLTALRYVIFGGEVLNPPMLLPWLDRYGDQTPELVNMYGITETTVHVTYHRLHSGECHLRRHIVGKPLRDLHVCLLDARQQPVPLGVPGEICVGGAGLARGYWHRDTLTKERFIINPFSTDPDQRLYRSGDWGRYREDGTIEYLGRKDQQIKIRGFRIELGEIEAALLQCPEVQSCVVLPKQIDTNNIQLIAYVVNKGAGGTLNLETLQANARSYLPDYMRPSAYVPLRALPLTANGKVDYQTLLARHTQTLAPKHKVAPTNVFEERLARIFREALARDEIGIDDNFFELGGHSLLAINLMAKINQEFNQPLLLAALFSAPTIRQLAQLLTNPSTQQQTTTAQDILVTIRAGNSSTPLFGVPGAGGQVLSFYPLANRLPALQAFYGLQSLGIDGVTPPLTSVEAIARANITAMKSVQPHGPYRLIGHSFGGLVAYEMACLLMSQGEAIDYLLLLDVFATLFSTQERRNSMLERMNKDDTGALFDLCELIGRFYDKKLAFKLGELQAIPAQQRMDFIVGKFLEAGIDISLRQFQGFYNVYNANFFAALNYQPRKIDLPMNVALFYSSELLQLMRESGWDELLVKKIELFEVKGSHVSMLSEDNVDSLSSHLVAYMQRFEQPGRRILLPVLMRK